MVVVFSKGCTVLFFHSSLLLFLCCLYVVFVLFFYVCFYVVFLLSACSAISIDNTLRCKCLSRLNMVVRLHVGAGDRLTSKEN